MEATCTDSASPFCSATSTVCEAPSRPKSEHVLLGRSAMDPGSTHVFVPENCQAVARKACTNTNTLNDVIDILDFDRDSTTGTIPRKQPRHCLVE